ncbi:MAG TPA: ABC transporter permease, partial [Candidatus Limnocylindrales bacterium]
MRGLVPLAWRSLAARPLRSGLTVAGIALGVGVLFASLATNAAIERSADRTVEAMLGNAELRVSAFQETGLSARSVAAIASAPGVAAAAPAVERRTYLRPELNGTLASPVTVLGIDPVVDSGVHDYHLTSGAALTPDGSATAVITERLARDDGYQLGSEISLQGAGEPESFRVVGIVAGDGPVPDANGRTVIVPIAAVTRIFDVPGVTRVDVRTTNDVAPASVEQALVDRLTGEPYVLSTAADLAASLRASTADFQATMSLIAAVALFAGAFLIFNTVSMTVAERVREVGLLRAAGATRRQVTRFVLAGAAVLGAIGAAVGLLVGVLLALGIGAYVRSITSVRVEDVGAPMPALVAAFAVGLLVTLVAAFEPAWRAGRIPPVEALRLRADSGGGSRWRLRWVLGVFAVVGIVGLVISSLGGGTASVTRAFAVYGVLLAATVLSPFVIAPLGLIAGLPFAAAFRFEERLARRGLVRERGRTALTVGALTVGLAMIVAIGG